MNPAQMRGTLISLLKKLFDMKVMKTLAEFWQGELSVLHYIYQHSDEEVNPSMLSTALRVSRARVTMALAALRRKKLITMQMCEHDRRRMWVALTASGEGYVRKKLAEVEQLLNVLMEGLGEENVKEFIRLIELSVDVMSPANQKTPVVE